MGSLSSIAHLARAATLALALGGCLLASGRGKEASPPTLSAAKVQASFAAPILPVVVLRTARDDLGLEGAARASVAMIAEEAESRSHVVVHARAAFLEILAQSVEEGTIDEVDVALFADQVAWSMEEAARPLRTALLHLHDALTEEQRVRLVSIVIEKLPLWSPTWAAREDHRWLRGFPQRDLAELSGELVRTGRGWTERSAANVRKNLPTLDATQRRALAASLRTGHFD